MNSEPRVGIGILILKDKKTLLGLRKHSHGANTYQSPGGHLEYMESFEQCAKREVMEECGIEIENIRFLCVANVREFDPKHYVHIGLTADWKSGEVELREPEKNGPWGWYSIDNLPKPMNFFTSLAFKTLKEGMTYFDGL